MARTELLYPEASLSLNKLRKMNKHAYKDFRNKLKRWYETRQHFQHTGPVRLTFIRMGIRELDWDNLVGGAKPNIDALVLAGIIQGDKPKDIPQRDYQQVKAIDKHQQRTIIIIEDL